MRVPESADISKGAPEPQVAKPASRNTSPDHTGSNDGRDGVDGGNPGVGEGPTSVDDVQQPDVGEQTDAMQF